MQSELTKYSLKAEMKIKYRAKIPCREAALMALAFLQHRAAHTSGSASNQGPTLGFVYGFKH